LFQRPIILASKSPRRSQLLRESGFNFTVQTFETNEDFDPATPAHEVAPLLAQRKAEAGKAVLTNDAVLLAADTTVVLDDMVLNKPDDYNDAFRMLRLLAGRQHTVVTGICLCDHHKTITASGVSQVWFSELSDDEIDYYLRSCKPYDKAGAYGVQEWIGLCKIHHIEGTYANIMGLPVDLVYRLLMTHFLR
jgi:septum formation protein